MPSNAVEGPEPLIGRLTVDVRIHERSVVVSPAGELDHDSVGILTERLTEALGRPGPDQVVVDCRHLRFCDSTGLNALLVARREAEQAGSSLVLADLQPAVARVFDITGAGDVFTVCSDLAAAVAG